MTAKPLQLHRTAQQMGFRMPAEWAPAERIWLTTPHNEETWPGCLDAAQRQFALLVDRMQPYVSVCTTESIGVPTNDSWIRDYGPIFVVGQDGSLACHDFTFNCWGGKYEPYDDDNRVPLRVAEHLQIPVWQHDFVFEGGSIDVNGVGCVMTTRQCLLEGNRNPHLSQAHIENKLYETLGATHTLWLPGGIDGDDTDGHIDDVARFINPNTVAAVRAPSDHPDHAILERNWAALQQGCDQNGAKLNLLELPVPDPLYYAYPADAYGPAQRRQLPASYANFLIANDAVFVPLFGQHHDDITLRRLEAAMDGLRVIGVRAEHLIVGLGAFHCLSMQQPRCARQYRPGPTPNA